MDHLTGITSSDILHLNRLVARSETLYAYVNKFGLLLGNDIRFNDAVKDRGDQLWQAMHATEHVLPRLANAARQCVATATNSGQ